MERTTGYRSRRLTVSRRGDVKCTAARCPQGGRERSVLRCDGRQIRFKRIHETLPSPAWGDGYDATRLRVAHRNPEAPLPLHDRRPSDPCDSATASIHHIVQIVRPQSIARSHRSATYQSSLRLYQSLPPRLLAKW